MSLLGEEGKFYYSATPLTNATYATPLTNATELDIISNLDHSFSRDVASYRTRGEAFVINKVSKKDAKITFELKHTPGNAGFTAIRDAFNNGTVIAGFAMDQAKATSGAQGLVGNWYVSNFSKGEPMGGFQIVNVELVAASYNGWHTV